METTVTNLPGNKGAFAESMCGSAVYYTGDMTVAEPDWRLVYDHTAAASEIDEQEAQFRNGGCDGGGWIQTGPNDDYLYHVVMGRRPGTSGPDDPGAAGMLYALDIENLVASGTTPECSLDSQEESFNGGDEADCPTLVDVMAVDDPTSGGPHWGALDHFEKNEDGTYSETTDISRVAYANYFVARAGWDGDHKVCMVDIDENEQFTLDENFRDEVTGEPCVDFNRFNWPHGPFGNAKPHSILFVVPDAAFQE
jgi:hypothetical protein